VLRDVICNEIPMVFRHGQLYATCSFLGCWVYLLADSAKLGPTTPVIAGTLVTFILRVLALRFNLTLPK